MMSKKRENAWKNFCQGPEKKKLSSAVKLSVTWEYQFAVCQALDLTGSIVRSVLKSKDRIKEFGTPLRALKLNSTLCTANC